MTKKTYPEHCIELAECATKGPWHIAHMSETDHRAADIEGPENQFIADDVYDHDRIFIIKSREMVPELARRLQRACEALRNQSLDCFGVGDFRYDENHELYKLAEELEALP